MYFAKIRKMSTKSQAVRGVIFNWLGRGCSFALTFVVTPIVVNGLGKEGYGYWAIVMSLTNYYVLAELGTRTAGVKYIAQFDAVNDRVAVNRNVVALLVFNVLMIVPVLVAAECVGAFFPVLFGTGNQDAAPFAWS